MFLPKTPTGSAVTEGDTMPHRSRRPRTQPATPPGLHWGRRTLAAVLSAAALATLASGQAGAATVDHASVTSRPLVGVIVTGADTAAAVRAVTAAGGRVGTVLPLIGGVVAEVPAGADLGDDVLVTPNRAVSFASADEAPDLPASTVRATLGLRPDGDEGRGVTVAVVDTGVADVPDLSGRIVGHVDVTGSGDGDGYGHGTFMAGLIAASGESSGGAYRGVAPGSQILDVKVARQDGSTDLSSVLVGLQAVADRGPAYRVRVLNLSLSSGSTVPYQVDPLNQALRVLWRRGVTVVVSSGNDGPEAGSVSAPGNDPALLTVGGVHENGTAARDDDTVAAWSGRGPTTQGVSKPDLVAPGGSVIGLRSPGSVIDGRYPGSRVGEDYFRGSGTSMSAAVTSAAVAGLLAENPRLRPDDVKQLLRGTAYRSAGLADAGAAGSGGLDLAAAFADVDSADGRARADRTAAAPGSREEWRALSAAIEAGDTQAATRAWYALDPQARSWAARSWAALDTGTQEWVARSWVARSWASTDAEAQEWAARSWAARSWAGDGWSARSWAARSWAGDDWAARSWAGDDWAARSWASENWSARSWSATWA
jgi:serine protease AprX